jgi:hypothetical protein
VTLLDNEVAGKMQGVRGNLYERGQPVNDFVADFGESDPDNDELELRGSVKIVAKKVGATLQCDQLVWKADANRFEAKGNVRMEGFGYTVGPFSEVWASPDLNRLGTPDVF